MSQNSTARILMVDNYDSFTFNLVHYLEQLDAEVIVKRNDELTIEEIEQIAPTHIVISPGPCDPDKAGLSLKIIDVFKGKIPILGVCLGHQAIAQAFGAHVVRAEHVVHGKTSPIHHTNQGVFRELPQGFQATRYHSLIIEKDSLPDCFDITAWTENEAGFEYIMGVKHKTLPLEGVQFHPESVMSDYGLKLLHSFVS
ncbi:MAG: aminodeoxychorismate/anthranilate synthase component II [Gammaproteobacteria bacterium]|nr:aminodeoxychorismate/anthranilate synthase component II [Gammaproteobacteria bacterium]